MRIALLILILAIPMHSQEARRAAGTSSVQPPAMQQQAEPAGEPGTIEGLVLNLATGEPVKKANLTLMPTNPGPGMQPPYGATSDAGGHFGFRDIPPGTYRMMVERAGFVRASYGARSSMRAGTTITVQPGQKVTGIDFKLTPQGVVTGRVMDEDGEPVMNVSVQAMRSLYAQGRKRLMTAGYATTNDLGEYRIHSLAPGKYILSAVYRSMHGMAVERGVLRAGEADEGYAPTYYPGTNEPSGAAPVEVTSGGVLRGTDIQLLKTRTMRVRGRIANAVGNRAGRTSVMLVPRDSTFMGFERNNAATQADGRFEIRGVVSGSYVLMANYWDEGKSYFARQPVEVTNTNLDGITLTIGSGIDVPGAVRVEGGGTVGLENLHASVQPRDFTPMMGGGGGPLKNDGSFALQNLGPEVYTFQLYGQMGNAYLKSVRMGDQDVLANGLDITSGAAGSLDVVLSTNGGQVEGTVTNAKGEPATTAMVVLIPDAARATQTHLFKATGADQHGHFALRGVAPGEYKVYAWEDVDPSAWQDPEFMKPFETKGESISIRENSRENLRLKVIPAEASGTAGT